MPLVAHLSFRFHSENGGGGGSKYVHMYVSTRLCQYFIVMVSLAALPPKIDFQSLPRRHLSPDSSRHFRHGFVNIIIVIIRSHSLPYTQKLTLELPISKAIRTSLCVRHLHMNVFVHYECLEIVRVSQGFAICKCTPAPIQTKKIHSQPLATAHA